MIKILKMYYFLKFLEKIFSELNLKSLTIENARKQKSIFDTLIEFTLFCYQFFSHCFFLYVLLAEYKLKEVAIDKAGNKVNTKSIVYGTFTNEQNVEEKYVPVLPGQKTQSIIENSEYSIANDKRQKSGNDLVATGDKLKTQNDTYIVITKGDITGSGKADIMSLIQLRKNIVGLKNFTKIQQLASDINSDGITNSIDLVGERKLIVGVE